MRRVILIIFIVIIIIITIIIILLKQVDQGGDWQGGGAGGLGLRHRHEQGRESCQGWKPLIPRYIMWLSITLTKTLFVHYFILCEGDLAWRLCSREVKAGWEVPPWWIRTSATINIRPNTIQVSYNLFCGEDNFRNRYRTKVSERDVLIDFWDTAGQERFNTMHRSYYHQAHACIMVFDATRKVTAQITDTTLKMSQTTQFTGLCASISWFQVVSNQW